MCKIIFLKFFEIIKSCLADKIFAPYMSTTPESLAFLFMSMSSKNFSTTPLSLSIKQNKFIPVFEMVLGAITYVVIIAMTIIGNIMVVVAVFNHRPLNKVQNYFLVSLAASDLAVAVVVMPLHVVKFLADGRWLMGVTMCQIFTTSDILLCTSSIWNLCAIALDRYYAIRYPIIYAQKRTKNFVCSVIALVWLVSILISVPPLIGWNDWSSQKLMNYCELTTEKAFIVYSASGSFFVPLALMVVVYFKIFLSARERIRTNRDRSALLRVKNNLTESCSKYPIGSLKFFKILKNETNSQKPRSMSFISNKKQNSITCRFLSNKVNRSQSTLLTLNVPSLSTNKSTTLNEKKICDAETTVDEFNKTSNKFDANNKVKSNGKVLFDNDTPKKTINSKKFTTIVDYNGNVYKKPAQLQLTSTVVKTREKISVAKEKRAAKTIAIIIFVFVFCWLPFFCVYVILPFCKTCYIHPKMYQAVLWLGYINSTLNPFLYGILNIEFRRAFKKILCPKRFRLEQKQVLVHVATK